MARRAYLTAQIERGVKQVRAAQGPGRPLILISAITESKVFSAD